MERSINQTVNRAMKTHSENTIVKCTALIVILVLAVASCSPVGSTENSNNPSNVPITPVSQVVGQDDRDPTTPTTTEKVAVEEVAFKDGASLLELHCSQCHEPQTLVSKQKSRSDWELTLKLMAGMGVKLSDAEMAVLIDHLANGGE